MVTMFFKAIFKICESLMIISVDQENITIILTIIAIITIITTIAGEHVPEWDEWCGELHQTGGSAGERSA